MPEKFKQTFYFYLMTQLPPMSRLDFDLANLPTVEDCLQTIFSFTGANCISLGGLYAEERARSYLRQGDVDASARMAVDAYLQAQSILARASF